MEGPTRVVVTDIDIKFWSMIWIMFKLAFAVLPAALLVTAASAALWSFLASLGWFFDRPGADGETMRQAIDLIISIAMR